MEWVARLMLQIIDKPMNLREMVKMRNEEIARGDLQPPRAAELLTEFSALMGNCNDEIRKRDVEYNKVLLQFLESEEKANRAKIKAECSPEYLTKREARDTKEIILESIRSLKYYLRAKSEEYREAYNQ